jgi:hypothetical protein
MYHLIDARPHGRGIHRLRKARTDVVGCEREAPCVCVSNIALVPGVLTVVLPVVSEMWGAYTIGSSRTFGTGAEPCKRWDRQTTRLLTIYWYEHSPEAMV